MSVNQRRQVQIELFFNQLYNYDSVCTTDTNITADHLLTMHNFFSGDVF